MRYFYLTILIIFSFSTEAYSCELTKLEFGSSVQQVTNKYNLPDEYEKEDILEVDLRSSNLCKKFGNERAKLIFFKNKLTRIYLEKISTKIELYEMLKKQIGELNVVPNFAEIKNQKFVGVAESDNFIAHYTYQKLDKDIFESVNISKKDLLKDLLEFEAKGEEKKE